MELAGYGLEFPLIPALAFAPRPVLELISIIRISKCKEVDMVSSFTLLIVFRPHEQLNSLPMKKLLASFGKPLIF